MIRKATRGPRVDLFARDTREGWVAWGNESEKFDEANMKAKEKLEEIKEVIAFIDSMVVE
jgi:N6-adenosine-specific RNA methylase IME4